MPAKVSSQVQLLLKDFVSSLKQTLGQNLIGVYLYGSFATGDFDADLSDVDLLIVLNDEVDTEMLHLLTALHNNFKTNNEAWSTRIDVAYLSKEALRTFKEKPSKVIVSSGGDALEIVNAPEYYLIDWYKAKEHAVTLYGPAATTLIPHITPGEFTRTIFNYMLTLPQQAAEASKRGQEAYVVVTMCRSFYAYTQGAHTSKKTGAEWVATKYPQWSSLIEKSLRWSRDEKNNEVEDRQNQLQTQEFIKFMLSKVEEV